jgi:hypothetical protein
MHETTLYLPDDLKVALEKAAAQRRCSMASIVRDALRAFTASLTPPPPTVPLIRSGQPDLAEQLDDALEGFGER